MTVSDTNLKRQEADVSSSYILQMSYGEEDAFNMLNVMPQDFLLTLQCLATVQDFAHTKTERANFQIKSAKKEVAFWLTSFSCVIKITFGFMSQAKDFLTQQLAHCEV